MTSLSVIIPAKDVAPYIGDTLNSLTRNHRSDFEYVVIDDGSTDATPDIVDGFRKKLPGLRMLHNSAPTGLSSVRNQGVAASDGRYVTFLDGDDWLAPGYLPKAVEAIQVLGVDFIRTDHVQVTGQNRTLHKAPEGRVNQPLPPRSGILPTFTRSMVDYPYASTGLLDRRLADEGLLDFDTRLLTCEDQPWIWRLHLRAGSFARVPIVGLFYRRDVPGSLTQVGDHRQMHFFDAFEGLFNQIADDRDADLYLPKATRAFCSILINHLDRKKRLRRKDQKQLPVRGRSLLRRIPHHILDPTLREMGGLRESRLRSLLGPGKMSLTA
ncbi:glycosyl transferase [Nocardiopsis terrae]|uniref:Glycosyltransferase involved in cell wall biosynthesis n=1 Tax=Nocardiopsis terrae TaxID=372655 RepID=A0ABR9HM73_9ACTN|nr:glycosyltransferase family 2 protein [Nocardiopsis terrae]MBE1460128.1 glycosyltransferase involved in cell wall biosynthesis [Nocardiopsis terrae]GHC69847.1 glycosyl transferase [Nocardiopsis terrae]